MVLLLDPSRLSRNQYVAHWFTHDARQYGVKVVYARMPEPSPVVDILVTPIMHALAEYHSWESKQKGLAGMAENVRRGFRAGGRAPIGYKIERIATGAIREGEPVMKSRLVPGPDAPKVAEYLKLRAAGIPRNRAAARTGLEGLVKTSLNGIEHNALTYAGHTVWNVHNERTKDGYVGGKKRRPRSEWVMQRDTHQPSSLRKKPRQLSRISSAARTATRRTAQHSIC
jgi:site-specific DNA recombinase